MNSTDDEISQVFLDENAPDHTSIVGVPHAPPGSSHIRLSLQDQRTGGFLIYISAVPLAVLGWRLPCFIKEKSAPSERRSLGRPSDGRPPRCWLCQRRAESSPSPGSCQLQKQSLEEKRCGHNEQALLTSSNYTHERMKVHPLDSNVA